MVHEIESAKAPMLSNRYVYHHSHEADLDDLNISLVHQNNISYLWKLGGALLSELLDQVSQNLLRLVCLMVLVLEGLRLSLIVMD